MARSEYEMDAIRKRGGGFLRLRSKRLESVMLGLLVLLTTLNTAGVDAKVVGKLSIMVLLFVGYVGVVSVTSLRGYVSHRELSVAVPSGLLVCIYLLSALGNGFGVRDLVVCGELAFLFSLFIVASRLSWGPASLNIVASSMPVFLTGSAIVWLRSGTPSSFMWYFTNPNIFGVYSYLSMFFPLAAALGIDSPAKRLKWYIPILSGLIVIVSSGSRSVWLAVLGTAITYLLWGRLVQRPSLFSLWLVFVFACIAGFVVVYSAPADTVVSHTISELSVRVTGKNLFSGRQRLWGPVIEAILANPLTGHGASAVPGDIMATTLSAHNLYLQVTLQVGFVGLGVLLWLLCSIWRLFWCEGELAIARLSGSFFVGILIQQTYEVSLTQNNMTIGLLQWIIIGMGFSAMKLHENGSGMPQLDSIHRPITESMTH